MTNKQLNEGHRMNFEQFEWEDGEVRLIVEEAMAMHAEMVAAGAVKESNDPLVMFRRGVVHGIDAMMAVQDEYNIKAKEVVARAANN